MLKRQLYNVLHGSSSASSSSSSDDDGNSDVESPAGEDDQHDLTEPENDEQQDGRSKVKKSGEESLVLEIKRVHKCKVCPKIVCLSESSMQAHLLSKGHARAVKKLSEGRLKATLNSEGEEEEAESDGETHAERHARMLRLTQKPETKKRMRNLGRQRQRKRVKSKTQTPTIAAGLPGSMQKKKSST